MSGKRILNKSHPLVGEYTEKFYRICDEFNRVEDEMTQKHHRSDGRDVMEFVMNPYRKKFYDDIKALQKEYDFLFLDK